MTRSLSAALLLASGERLTATATTQVFAPPRKGPFVLTANHTSFSKSTLKDNATCKGKAFNRIIQVWLVNTDFVVRGLPSFYLSVRFDAERESLVEQGILPTNYNAVTHLSEPNWETLSFGGDFFGMHDDNIYHIPSYISTVVDPHQTRASAERHTRRICLRMSFMGSSECPTFHLPIHLLMSIRFSYNSKKYISPGSADYPSYVRKLNPLMIYVAVSPNAKHVKCICMFNAFANDVVNGTLRRGFLGRRIW
ncbi:hypothetical protein B0H13DRAFT_1633177 [Mycena leptocephala]|nr:hypothetical protein B0H13DRAFT_1633177 [Mycena leptocephala]